MMPTVFAVVGMLAATLPSARSEPAGKADQTAISAEIPTLFESINAAWARHFATQSRVFAAPRLLTLRSPSGHPAHGAGYSRGLVIVELSDADAIDRVFGARSRSLTALLIAHEVGHHIQYLQRRERAGKRSERAVASEWQADCYAGWWLGTSEASSGVGPGQLPATVNLDSDFPRLIHLLSMAQTGRLVTESDPTLHGSPAARVRAIRIGQSSPDPSVCEQAPSQIQAPR